MTITRKRLMSAMEKSKQTWSPHLKPSEPSEAEVEAAAREIGRVLEETQGEGVVFNPRENDFDWRPELRVMARAALIAADKARRG